MLVWACRISTTTINDTLKQDSECVFSAESSPPSEIIRTFTSGETKIREFCGTPGTSSFAVLSPHLHPKM
ncbi:unnamed protein product [Allacma fusca]|uniref:Uncharacterized protein n=1 Tax=Allacma fusca TaxID=39272 RepID=A0A8J2KF45_9HEXA|nr:unnamed protein product [Allacma fusca]